MTYCHCVAGAVKSEFNDHRVPFDGILRVSLFIFTAITDILVSQPQGKILVGDPHQQIYSFRGAVNAMEHVRADTIFYLTQSFRFGPEISHVAACCLEILKKEKKKTLVGSGKKGNLI